MRVPYSTRHANHLKNIESPDFDPLKMSQSDEEDDYMNMVFDDAPKQPAHETSLQRAARKRKEV